MKKKLFANPSVRFLAISMGLFIVWSLLYDGWLMQSAFNRVITDALGVTSQWMLNLAGYEMQWTSPAIWMAGREMIYIGPACSGLEFFGLFACFVVAFPARLKQKLIFLPLGLLIIHLLNMLRVQLLILNFYFHNSSFEFNHHYTFQVVLYGIVLVMWVYWARKQVYAGTTA